MKIIAEFVPTDPVRLPSNRREARLRPVRKKTPGGMSVIDIRATLERYRRKAMAHPDRRSPRPSLVRMGRAIEGIAVVAEEEEEYEGLTPLSPLWQCLRAADEVGVSFDLYYDWLLPRRSRRN